MARFKWQGGQQFTARFDEQLETIIVNAYVLRSCWKFNDGPHVSTPQEPNRLTHYREGESLLSIGPSLLNRSFLKLATWEFVAEQHWQNKAPPQGRALQRNPFGECITTGLNCYRRTQDE